MAFATEGSGVSKGDASDVPAVAYPTAESPLEVAANIKYHALYSPHFSPLKFEAEQAFYATAESVRDTLIQRWNETYAHFHKVDPKQTYYLSMEYLQGRALTNAIGNLGIRDAYADALNKLGHDLENVANQEQDAALGNGGLGRLASCFLDSMATLNLPAWGYGLRYRYGLFKQLITKQGQEESAEDWLEKFSPWEIIRHDVVYSIRFFGHVEVMANGGRKWVGGEELQALAYDVPIPGYKTKNTINLRLWEAKATAQDFNLFAFNEGQHENAAHLHSSAQQICAVLYPGDVTEEGKLLRLKQQFFLCSASLQVNGVAELHSNILKAELFVDYFSLWPKKFQNKTNGITPRRWLHFCNPGLSAIITKWLKTDQWVTNLDLLDGLRQFADNSQLQREWASAKMANKIRLAQYIFHATGVEVNPNSLFDIQIKRIHEYKRQLLNILGTIYRYKKLKEMSPEDRKKMVPRTIILGGKAFATYTQAKRIVKLVNGVGAVVNSDPDIGDLLKVIFIPNYNVSVAEIVIPGSELSQHISTAGMEASGTSNMKFALNGCLIIGTLDGANVEIREEIGKENFFLFGAQAHEVPRLRKEREQGLFIPDPHFEEAKQFVRSQAFGDFDYNPLLDSLEGNTGYGRGDYFLVGHDFPGYMEAQSRVDEAYKDKTRWLKMSILSTAGSGKFSSDRTISQYAKDIWHIQQCSIP